LVNKYSNFKRSCFIVFMAESYVNLAESLVKTGCE